MRPSALLLALAALGGLLPGARLGAQQAETYPKEIVPLLEKYCRECHGPEKHRGDLDFQAYRESPRVLEERAVWEKVRTRLRSRIMPPKNRPQPAPAERDRIVRWIESELGRFDCTKDKDPGRVTIRRLNRAEYNNTIRDLLAVDFKPADDFPSDDVGYGFDNIGDVLSLPPLLFEKYLAAAEQIAARAVVTPEATKPPVATFVAERLQATRGDAPARNGVKPLLSTGELFAEHEFPAVGRYVLRANAYGEQAGPETVRMAFRLDGKDVEVVEVAAVKGAPRLYESTVEAEAGKKRCGVAFLNDYYKPDEKDRRQRDRNLMVEYLEVVGPLPAAPPELPESHRRLVVCQPGEDKAARAECARTIVERLATRAFRRPASAEEVAGLVGFVELGLREGESFERGIQLALQAVLVSPHFLFRVEEDREPDGPGGGHAVSDWELATRLSYFLWSSMPDEELFGLARAGALRRDGNLEAQVRRMLAAPASRTLVENFASQWLQVRNLKTASPDPGRFPLFNDELRAAMARESEMFFEAVMHEDRSVLDFLDADFTFLNAPLARLYGIPGVEGNEFRRVTLPGRERGGVLTQASVLTVTSNPTRTSPVKRGKWILEQVLGAPPPPPPPGADQLAEDEASELSGSLRQRMEQHRANPSCAVCHEGMDPLGFGLENFDAIGAWRERDGSFPVDASGTLPGGESFNGPAELKAILKGRKDEFVRCLAEKMLTFALGRGLEYYDRCAVEEICGALAANGYRFSVLVLEIVKSDPFQRRRSGGTDG